MTSDSGLDVQGLVAAIENSPTGVLMSADGLERLAADASQVIDGIFVGFHGDLPSRDSTDLRLTGNMIIEMVESTFWRVYSADDRIAQLLTARFHGATSRPDGPIPGAHR